MRETTRAPEGSTGPSPGTDDTQIRTFLIADVRGYTTFTQEHGDEAAAALVTQFAEIVRDVVVANEGTLIELRGDEALAAFSSPRRAIRAAVALQSSMLEQTRNNPSLPLPVGIGIDAGEAVPVDDGYRGGALNLAARLCADAGPGEILGSQSVVHLARTLEGIEYLDRGEAEFKGLAEPTRVFSIASSAEDVAAEMADLAPRRPERVVSRGRLRFRILGPVEVAQVDETLAIGAPRQRAVLAHLLIRANEVISSEGLVEAVWGDEAPGSARSTLYTYVSHLRAVLGQDRIESQTPGYRLRLEPGELDSARFEQLLRDAEKAKAVNPRITAAVLDEALALWRGPALADVADEGSLLAEAARLNELRLGASEDRIESLLATGEQSRAIPEAEALLDRHPLRERIWTQLMLALYRDGRQAEALNAYQRVRELLADELGIDPSPELVRLHERILQQDPGLELRGEPLRGYRLLEKIDEGPTGVVFRAIQPHVGRDVAIKIVHDQLASSPSFVRRFERDAQAIAALEHPHIVPVYDYWREPGQAYVVSRYLREGSLRGIEDRGVRLEPDRALIAVEQVATALAFAHGRRIVHGNVGPSNVLFDGESNAYLADFRIGVAYLPEAVEADIRGLAATARHLVGAEALPPALDELLERVTAGSAPASAIEVAAAVTQGSQAAPLPTAVDVRNPYKGLRAFTEVDAEDFFGRGELTSRLLARLEKGGPGSRFLAVVGPSGGGKSSVVRAGVIPAIRTGALGDPQSVYVTEMFPGQHPLDELEAALLRVSTDPTSRVPDLLDAGSRGLLDSTDLVLPAPAELVVVVDQFEEVFTLTTDEHEREVFLESLRVATADPESRIRVIVTLRADFYDRPLTYPRFGEMLAAATEVVAPLTPDETEQAVRKPAEGVGVSIEPGLLAEIVADVAHQPGALPLLQYGLTELFERRDGDRLTLESYREIGGVSGALSARAERLLAGMTPDGQRTGRQIFLRLVTLGEGREDTRRRVVRSELDSLEADTRVVDEVVDTFGRHRLLTFDRDPTTREPTVEIAHEALLGGWQRLRTWIDDARDDLRQERRLAHVSGEWRGAERDPSFLIRGARLQQVEAWTSSTDLSLGQLEREYLKASLDRRDEERKEEEARAARERALERRSIRRMRGLVAVLTAAAIVAGALTTISVKQRDRARGAETAQLAQRLGAQALVEEDLDLSLLLARQAVAIDDSPQTRGYLLSALQNSPHATGVMHGTDILRATAISPDGETLAVSGYGDGLLFFDARTYRQIGHVHPRRLIESLAYSPDGTLAVGGERYVRLIDGRTGEPVAETNVAGTVYRMAFTADGSRLVVLASPDEVHDARITIREVATLRRIGPSIEPEAFTGAYVGFEFFSPHFVLTRDERSLVTASEGGELALWDLSSGEKMRTFPIATGLHALALSPDGRTAAVGIDGGLQLVDLSSGRPRTATDIISGRPNWLLFSPDGEELITTNLAGTVTLWDPRSGRPDETLRGHSSSVQQPVFSPDGKTLYTVSHDGTAVAWDMTGERGLGRSFRFTTDRKSTTTEAGWEGHPGEFSPDDRLIAVGLQDDGIQLLDARELTPVGGPLRGTGGEVKGLRFSPDGRTLAATGFDGILTLWDVGTRSRLLYKSVGRGVVGLDFSPDGKMLAITPPSVQENAAERIVVRRRGPHQEERRGGVRFLDAATGAPLGKIGVGEFEAGGTDPWFSADGTMIATGRGFEGGADVWDVATGDSIASVDAIRYWDRPLDAPVLSPDGSTLALGGWVPTVRLVDVRTGTLLHELDPGAARAFDFEFLPDGRTLAISGWESVASLWDVATGTQIGPRLTAGSRRTALDLSHDGRRLLLTSSNGEGVVWNIDPELWKQRACDVANRTLTREEWDEFLPGRPYDPACI